MTESVIVTVNDLKKFSSISDNIDPELLTPHLLISQQMNLFPVLGQALYDDIISKFDNTQLTGSPETTLYENYIVPALAFSAWANAAPFLAYHTTRNGLMTMGTDVLTPLTPDEMPIYLSRVNGFRDFYLGRLIDYLDDNKTSFPLYRKDETPVGQGSQIFLGFKKRSAPRSYWGTDGYYFKY
jgi:hypothetical protein